MASIMKQYSSLIMAARRANRKKLKPGQPGYVYYAGHHIRPRCLGIDNRASNLVLLTFSEHVEAHMLLAKLYPRNSKLQITPNYTLNCKKGEPISIEVAAEASKLAAKTSSDKWSGDLNPSHEPEHRAAASERMMLMNQGDSNPSKTPEGKLRLAIAWSGDKHPMKKQKNRKALSKRNSLMNKQQVTCPHCNKTGGLGGMQVHHFDNCLQHPDNLGLNRQQIKARRQALVDSWRVGCTPFRAG